MSYPYPQDRNRDQREKGEQPYKAAREAISENEASIQAEAEAYGEAHQHRSEEERVERLENLATASMREVGADQERSREQTGDGDTAGTAP